MSSATSKAETAADHGEAASRRDPRLARRVGTRDRLAGRWRRWRPFAGIAAVVVAVAALGVVLTGSPGAGTLDPRAAGPDGSRALAEVLRREGVDLRRVTRVAAAVRVAGPGTTVLVVDASVLAPAGLRRLAATGADVVLVAPDGAALDALGVDLAPAGTEPAAVVAAACDDDDARAAARATGGGSLLRPTGPGVTVCFPGAAAAGGADGTEGDRTGDAGAYAVAPLPGGGTLRVLGQDDVLRNASVLTAGNAALALRVLGAAPSLVWLMASPLDAGTDQPAPTSLLPGWVLPLTVQLAVVALLAALWRGRRLGRLVAEPLPVVVRSAETAQGRAALYRRAGATDRAAAVLRAAVMTRLARRFGLPAGADAAAVVAAAAPVCGRAPADVAALLTGPVAPGDSAALVRLADDLDTLEAAVAAAAAPYDPDPRDPDPRGSPRP